MNQPQIINNFSQALSTFPKDCDVYHHLKQSYHQTETSCNCAHTENTRLYCLPCKLTVCQKCNLEMHKSHLLIDKKAYNLNKENINQMFKRYDIAIDNNDLVNSYEDHMEELEHNINDNCNKIIHLIETYRQYKITEMKKIIDTLKTSILNLHSKLKEVKTNLNEFVTTNSKFFSTLNSNNDDTNILFLINYDLITTSNLNYKHISNLIENLASDFNIYKNNLINSFINIQSFLQSIQFKEKEENTKQKQKVQKEFNLNKDENILIKNRNNFPELYFEFNCCKLNTNLFENINKKIELFTKQINKTKTNVYTSYLQYKNLKHIEEINTSYENATKKGIDSLFTDRKTLTKLNPTVSKENKVYKLSPNSNKDDIQLNNPTILKHFSLLIIDTYSKHFKPPTKKPKQTNNELIIKTNEETDDNEGDNHNSKTSHNNSKITARVIEDTNEISFYDRKKRMLIKKHVNLMKNPHGYTKFPIGCRFILIKDKLYISGGKGQNKLSNVVLVYDIKNEHLSRISNLNIPRSFHTMRYIDVFNTIIIIGGEQCNSIEIYDAITRRWLLLPALNHSRANPAFYFNKPKGLMYTMYGIEGKITSNIYTDVVEVLDLAHLTKGWKVLNVKNNIGTSLKTHLCVFPVEIKDKVLIYGGMKSRKLNKAVFVFDTVKNEYTHIDQKLFEELSEEAKTNQKLSYIVSTIHLNNGNNNMSNQK